jgi:hypothetical protein
VGSVIVDSVPFHPKFEGGGLCHETCVLVGKTLLSNFSNINMSVLGLQFMYSKSDHNNTVNIQNTHFKEVSPASTDHENNDRKASIGRSIYWKKKCANSACMLSICIMRYMLRKI